MLKLADGRPMSFLLESVEGGEKIGRYSIIGIKPDLIWRCFGDRAEINRNARTDADAFEPVGTGALASLRALIAECRVDDAQAAAADGGRPLRLYGLRHGRADRAPARRQSATRSAFPTGCSCARRWSRSSTTSPTSITVVTPVWPGAAMDAGAAYRARARAARRRARRSRAQPAAPARGGRGGAGAARPHRQHDARRNAWRMVETAKEYIRAGEIFQVVPSMRLLGAVPPAALRALPRAAPPQSVAVPVLPRSRRFRGGGIEPGDPGAAARRQVSASARSPARGGAAPPSTRTSASPPSCSPIPRSAPSI